jgi:signal transduction histidine kinase/ligand-binding sensor domain-containing protein/CheY-like chemotaxis protein
LNSLLLLKITILAKKKFWHHIATNNSKGGDFLHMALLKKNICVYLLLFVVLPFTQVKSNPYNFGRINYTHGLSNNHILCFAEDNNGFMWLGTQSGLNRFDGYNFKIFKHNPTDSSSLPDNLIESIVKDQLGRFWIGTPNGLTIFNPNTESFITDFNIIVGNESFKLHNLDMAITYGDSIIIFYAIGTGLIEHNIFTNKNSVYPTYFDTPNSSSPSIISHLAVLNHLLYVTYHNGVIQQINLKSKQVIKTITAAQEYFNRSDQLFKLYVDTSKNIWIYNTNEALGLLRIDTSGAIWHLTTASNPALNSNLVSAIIQDENNNYWIGTDHGGLNLLKADVKTIEYITHEQTNDNSLSQNVITTLYKNSKGIIWIGTFKQGANYYHKNLFRFIHYNHLANQNYSLPYNDVNCFAEDANKNLWIGTNGDGLVFFDKQANKFTPLNNINSLLKSKVIVSLFFDKNYHLWIGTYHGGLSVYDGKNMKHYLHDSKNPKSISDNKIWSIYEDTHGNLWIGMLNGGLDLFDREQQIFQHYSGTGINSLNSNFVVDIVEDKNGNIWFGTDVGVFVYDWTSSRFSHFSQDNKNDFSLSNNFTYCVFQDSKGNIWAGTRDGLNLYEPESRSFIRFNTNTGLPDNSIMAMLESKMGDLWLSTSGGLCKLVVNYNDAGKYQNHYTVNFNESDGLQGREFNASSAIKTSKGELIFGGSNGFNLFNPNFEDVLSEKYTTKIVGLEIFGKEVEVNPTDENRQIIRTSLLNNKTIKLKFKENIFSLKFVTVDYLGAKKISYRYKLEGFNDQWIYANWQDRKATFTNLNPGTYIFKVQSTGFNSKWSDSESTLNIIIQPPWYRTWAAYIAYYIFVMLVVFIARRILLQNERNRYKQDQAIKESIRQQELNSLKSRFFTNVSHEFRTPLTLILTPLEKLMKGNLDKETQKHLTLMHQNAKRLLTLVNQLLDFRKSEVNKLKIDYIYGNIIGFMNQTINSFSDFRESKKIELEFFPDEKELYMQFDKDKLEKILFNLLSNAFKFTPEKGFIRVFTEVVVIEGSEYLVITVRDNGIGLEEDQQQKIFERFYQTDLPNQFITKGSGIGLSLTKDFIDLLNGQISVKSKPGKGSDFIIKLPINRNRTSEIIEDVITEQPTSIVENNENELENETLTKSKKTILVVEDNADFRYYIKDSLHEKFNILESENGKLALELLESKQPDLIVSDVMMPEMDGFELCAEIKTNPSFSHIPIILLTAKSTQQDKIEGFNQGADEYITKPFSFEILESRIDYLLAQREKFIKQYQKSFQFETDTQTITPRD